MKTLKQIIKQGGVGVMRTDTLYGLVADAHNPVAIERVYAVKGRDSYKACIVLVAHYEQIRSFGVDMPEELALVLDTYWPGKVSIIIPVRNPERNSYFIHKGTGGIAFRIPADPQLRDFLKEVGPVVAPSANPQGQAPARTINEAQQYFGDKVDYYEDGGEVTDQNPSTIIRITDTFDVEIIRE